MSSDKTGKDHMINAIATVLHFSPHEVCNWLYRSCDIMWSSYRYNWSSRINQDGGAPHEHTSSLYLYRIFLYNKFSWIHSFSITTLSEGYRHYLELHLVPWLLCLTLYLIVLSLKWSSLQTVPCQIFPGVPLMPLREHISGTAVQRWWWALEQDLLGLICRVSIRSNTANIIPVGPHNMTVRWPCHL